MINNTDRVLNAAQALQTYRKLAPYANAADNQDLLVDLLTDLRHWAASQKLDFEQAQRVSEFHHAEERTS